MNPDIEKAHKVGDVHPNGKWVWSEYKPGKFDWRAKGTKAAKQALQESDGKKSDNDESSIKTNLPSNKVAFDSIEAYNKLATIKDPNFKVSKITYNGKQIGYQLTLYTRRHTWIESHLKDLDAVISKVGLNANDFGKYRLDSIHGNHGDQWLDLSDKWGSIKSAGRGEDGKARDLVTFNVITDKKAFAAKEKDSNNAIAATLNAVKNTIAKDNSTKNKPLDNKCKETSYYSDAKYYCDYWNAVKKKANDAPRNSWGMKDKIIVDGTPEELASGKKKAIKVYFASINDKFDKAAQKDVRYFMNHGPSPYHVNVSYRVSDLKRKIIAGKPYFVATIATYKGLQEEMKSKEAREIAKKKKEEEDAIAGDKAWKEKVAKIAAQNKKTAGKKYVFDFNNESAIEKQMKNIQDNVDSLSPVGNVVGYLNGDFSVDDLEDATNEQKQFLQALKQQGAKAGKTFDWKEQDEQDEYVAKQHKKGYKVYQLDSGDTGITILVKPKKTVKE